MGRRAHVSFGEALAADTFKAKLTLEPAEQGEISAAVAAGLQCCLSGLRALTICNVATDQGHRHSSGRSVIQLWIKIAPPGKGKGKGILSGKLRAEAPAFSPTVVAVEAPSSEDAFTQPVEAEPVPAAPLAPLSSTTTAAPSVPSMSAGVSEPVPTGELFEPDVTEVVVPVVQIPAPSAPSASPHGDAALLRGSRVRVIDSASKWFDQRGIVAKPQRFDDTADLYYEVAFTDCSNRCFLAEDLELI